MTLTTGSLLKERIRRMPDLIEHSANLFSENYETLVTQIKSIDEALQQDAYVVYLVLYVSSFVNGEPPCNYRLITRNVGKENLKSKSKLYSNEKERVDIFSN